MYCLEKIRKDFPILQEKVYGKPLTYLDNAATTQKPAAVTERLLEFYTTENGNIHRGVHCLSEQASAAYEAAREAVRTFIGAESSAEIIFTHGTTSAVNLVAQSFGEKFLGAGDEIIVTEMEHHSNFVPWQMLCERKGATLKILPFDDGGRLRIDLLDSFLTERTKLLTCVYVSNALGTVNPVKEITKRAHTKDVPVFLDGAQAIQHMSVDVQEIDCDFFAFSGHKMYAGTGVGVLYGKKAWLEKMPPYQYGGGMITSVQKEKTTFAGPPLKFEAGTPNIAAVLSLHAAIDYLKDIGMSTIAEHERRLFDHALERLTNLDGVTVYGIEAPRSGVLSFNLKGAAPYDIGVILDKLGIAVRTGTHCAEPVMRHFGIDGSVRAGFGLYNTHEEIERLAVGVRKAQAILQ
ncbi:MAG: SufS family cysteine desulfurase [Chitinivibrionales bacterium]|nr:SufS family cysteine desulfurase [Chitinivibrionales bacterium]MBD3357219.1 SufS family cysteine desulfurase [Chitinivibrionales bacterium]